MDSREHHADGTETWVVDVRPQCSKCERLSVVYDLEGHPFCARHATIFVTSWDESDSDQRVR